MSLAVLKKGEMTAMVQLYMRYINQCWNKDSLCFTNTKQEPLILSSLSNYFLVFLRFGLYEPRNTKTLFASFSAENRPKKELT